MCNRLISTLMLAALAACNAPGTGSSAPPLRPAPPRLLLAEETSVAGSWQPGEIPQIAWLARSGACETVPATRGEWAAEEVLREQDKPLCLYTWRSQNAQPETRAIRDAVPDAVVDPPTLVSLGDIDGAWSEPVLSLARTRLSIPARRQPPPPADGRAHVRVAILDSQTAAGGLDEDVTRHGTAVNGLIQELACGDAADCPVERVNYSVLQFRSGEDAVIRHVPRGSFGTAGMLAGAIEQAAKDWEALGSSKPQHLIINLSVGWSGCWGSRDTPPEQAPGMAAVHLAIARATCRGALVVAAAGNRDVVEGCPSFAPKHGRPEHMYPGLWAGEQVTADACRARYEIAKPALSEPAPLLYAISAVDRADRTLTTAENVSELVAYGQSVSLKLSAPLAGMSSSYTPAFSGSSMSAGAVSGIAAAVWAYHPELSTPEAMKVVWAGAMPLKAAPPPSIGKKLCNHLQGCMPVIRRASLCGALTQLGIQVQCDTPPGDMPSEAPARPMDVDSSLQPVDVDSCPTCKTCGKLTEWPAWAGNFDVRDVAWVQPQPDGGCGTCRHSSQLQWFDPPAERLAQRSAGPRLQAKQLAQDDKQALLPLEFQTWFPREARCGWLIVHTAAGEEKPYSLGTIPNRPMRWRVPAIPEAVTGARLRFTRAARDDGSGLLYYDETDVQVQRAPIFQQPIAPAVTMTN